MCRTKDGRQQLFKPLEHFCKEEQGVEDSGDIPGPLDEHLDLELKRTPVPFLSFITLFIANNDTPIENANQ